MTEPRRRCCMCRATPELWAGGSTLESCDLPGSGYRCTNYEACASRVRAVVTAHSELGKATQ